MSKVNSIRNQSNELPVSSIKIEKADSDISSQMNFPIKRGSLQLWQFLLQLISNSNKHEPNIIEWTRKSSAEFKLLDPEEVARKWGIQKNRPTMNYDKLSRSLRYYYEKGIMQKVAGERYVYRFINYKELYQIDPELVEPNNVPKFVHGIKSQSSKIAYNNSKHNILLKRQKPTTVSTLKSLKSSTSSSSSFLNKASTNRYAPYTKPYDHVVNISNDFNKIEPISNENLNSYDSSININNYKVPEYNYSQGLNCQDKFIQINFNNSQYVTEVYPVGKESSNKNALKVKNTSPLNEKSSPSINYNHQNSSHYQTVPYFDTPKATAPSNYSSNVYSKNHLSHDERHYNYNQCFEQHYYQNSLEYQQQYQASLYNGYYNQKQEYDNFYSNLSSATYYKNLVSPPASLSSTPSTSYVLPTTQDVYSQNSDAYNVAKATKLNCSSGNEFNSANEVYFQNKQFNYESNVYGGQYYHTKISTPMSLSPASSNSSTSAITPASANSFLNSTSYNQSLENDLSSSIYY